MAEASDFLYTCLLKDGHAGTTSWNSDLLPNLIMLLDALTKYNLVLRKSKDGDKVEPITKILFSNIISF